MGKSACGAVSSAAPLPGGPFVSAPARVQLRTVLPTSWTSGTTLHRLVRPSGLADGFQRAIVFVLASISVLSLALVYLYVPPWLEWLRFVRTYGFSGPADGCQPALKVSGLTPHDMVAQVSSRTPPRRQRWTLLAPKLWKFWGSFLRCFPGSCGSGFGFPSPGCSLLSPGFLCFSLFPWECRAVPAAIKDSTS